MQLIVLSMTFAPENKCFDYFGERSQLRKIKTKKFFIKFKRCGEI
jgi:hypothetical protein